MCACPSLAGPALVFDAFDCWHGAATWSDDASFYTAIRKLDTKGRQPFHTARCSIEMRFRIQIDMERVRVRALRQQHLV